MDKKVLVMTGGGTAGHVLPCLALIPFLKNEFPEIHFIGSNSGYEEKLVGDAAIYHGADAVKLNRGGNPFKMLPIPFKLMKAKKQAARLLEEIKPDAIFSKGGYVALPTVLAAKKKIPVYLHESDMTMGLANRLSVKHCRRVFTSFDTIEGEKVIHTGAPIRQSIYSGSAGAAAAICGFKDSALPVLLVVGGSSGAKAINECVYRSLDGLCRIFNVIHITGEKEPSKIRREGYFPIGYTDRIADFFAFSDFVISRGGSGALFELMALGKPTLVIPLPKGASRGDQIDNANYFTSRGAALMLKQEQLSPASLVSSAEKLASSKEALKSGMAALEKLDGTRRIAKIILEDSRDFKGR